MLDFRAPVVLVAGGIGDEYGMRRLQQFLSLSFYAVTIERRQSTNAVQISLEQHAQDLCRAIGLIGRQVYLVGHSYGATIAIAAAALCPHFCAGTVLIEPPLLTVLPPDDPERQRIATFYHSILSDLAAGKEEQAIETFVDESLGTGTWSDIPDDRRKTLLSATATYASMLQSTVADEVPSEVLAQMSARTLILVGESSDKAFKRVAARLAEILPNVQIEIVGGVGHGIFRFGPPSVLSQIADFLRSNNCSN
jgi:pimeloyl-ACP methyl ester carboxylesterase